MRRYLWLLTALLVGAPLHASPSAITPFDKVREQRLPPQITVTADLDREKPERLCAEAIDRAQSVIVFIQPGLRSKVIAKALLRAKERGVFIAGIVDPTLPRTDSVTAFLTEQHIAVLYWAAPETPMPAFAVVDYETVLLGQYDWSKQNAALPLLRIQEAATGSVYHNFWNDLQKFTMYPEQYNSQN